MLTLGSERAKFDVPPGIAYFNTAYNSPLLNASRDAHLAAAAAKSRPWERTPDNFFDDADRLRTLAAGLFGGDADGWAIVPAASYGVATAARAIEPRLKASDVILIAAGEFPSNVLAWRRIAATTGARIETVPTPEDGDWTRAILARLDTRVRVAALAHCHWMSGAITDLETVTAACRANGTATVLDVTQSLGAMPLDVGTVKPDFLVAAGYKWLLCPYGVGLFYVAPQWRDSRPLEESWLARSDARDFTSLADYSDAYLPGARRFDVGETCIASLPGAIAALEQLATWGVPEIAASLAAINATLRERLAAHGFGFLPEANSSPHLLGAKLPAGYAGDFLGEMRARNVFLSRRGDSLRIAPHLHVTGADIDQLFAAAGAVLG